MIKYKIALVNVFWSENENNTRYFINKNEQNSYFDNLASGKTSPLVNYNMRNNIVTTIIYKDTTNRRVDEIVKSNYAIVYTIDYNEETKEITLDCFEETEDTITTIKIVSSTDTTLELDFNGEIRKFEKEK